MKNLSSRVAVLSFGRLSVFAIAEKSFLLFVTLFLLTATIAPEVLNGSSGVEEWSCYRVYFGKGGKRIGEGKWSGEGNQALGLAMGKSLASGRFVYRQLETESSKDMGLSH
jgi:hypothetical protein